MVNEWLLALHFGENEKSPAQDVESMPLLGTRYLVCCA